MVLKIIALTKEDVGSQITRPVSVAIIGRNIRSALVNTYDPLRAAAPVVVFEEAILLEIYSI